jgi:hypothetical protein
LKSGFPGREKLSGWGVEGSGDGFVVGVGTE